MQEELESDVAVVGAGVHGSCAALHLARAGRRTILLEQFPVPHTRGSSHGQSRITRTANDGIPALEPIMRDALTQWQRLQEQAGDTLFRPAPMLAMSRGDQRPILEKCAQSVEEAGYTPVWLPPATVLSKFGITIPNDSLAVVDTSAGVLMADKCVAAIQRLFREAGGRMVDNWPVEGVEVGPDGSVKITGRRGTVRAGTVVLCPGPWAGPLLAKLGVHIPLRVEKISVFYWRIDDPTYTTTSFIDYHDPKGHFYGLPELEYPGLVKVVYHGGPEVKPEERDEGDNRDIKETTKTYVKERFPFLHPHPAIEETCMYTWTPDKQFVVDRHPVYKNVIFACGFSGSGFKIAPTIGQELCRLVLEEPTVFDLSAFSASRFSTGSK